MNRMKEVGELPEAAWESHYRQAFSRGIERLEIIPGVVVGFHSVLDGFKRVVPDEISRLINHDNLLRQQVESMVHADQMPVEINSPADLLAGFVYSFRRGKSYQLMIRNQETFQWALTNIGYDRLRVGGTSGNMANALAPLGLKKIVVYANPLTKELGELFVRKPNLFTVGNKGGRLGIYHPWEATDAEGVLGIHWVLEYRQGMKLVVGDQEFECPRDNRFYPCWNPVNNRLQVNQDFIGVVAGNAGDFSHFLISGYHLLSERYPDGSTYLDHLSANAEEVKKLKRSCPHWQMHLEMASIASPTIRGGIAKKIMPLVDSLGLNEVELPALLQSMGHQDLVERLARGESVAAFLEGLLRVVVDTGLQRVHFHNLGYYMALVKEDKYGGVQTRDALAVAALAAAYRAQKGELCLPQELASSLAVPISREGIEALEELGRQLNDPGIPFTGLAEYGGYRAVIVPTRVVDRPVYTVGLGDTISSVGFLAN